MLLKKLKFLIPFIVLLSLVSCASREQIVYLNGDYSSQKSSNYETRIQPDDVLYIFVSADDAESAVPFNMQSESGAGISGGNVVSQIKQQYLVDNKGNIKFPIIGELKMSGLTRLEAIALLAEKIKPYINDPIIYFRIINFKVTVLGEVKVPGAISIDSERITLLEALGKAGDLTIKGKRENIKVIREIDGATTINEIDITKTDFINSPYYYLAQNDVVYVEPNKVQINSSAYGPSTALTITIISFLLTTSLILLK
jgi:polysaccharide export outer membrane protein